jgi:hypothetical protein
VDPSLQQKELHLGEIRIQSNDPRFPELTIPVIRRVRRRDKTSLSNQSSGPIELSAQFAKQTLDTAQLVELEKKWREQEKKHKRRVKNAVLAGFVLGGLTLLYPFIAKTNWENDLRNDGVYLSQFEQIEHVLSSDRSGRNPLAEDEEQFRNELSVAQQQVEMLRTGYSRHTHQLLNQQLCNLSTLCEKVRAEGSISSTPRKSKSPAHLFPACPSRCRAN